MERRNGGPAHVATSVAVAKPPAHAVGGTFSGAKPPMTQIRMRGGGYYSAHTTGPRRVIDRTLPLILEALDALDPASSRTIFAIADFGAADGGTSIGLFRALLTELRARAPDRPITLTHTDLPYNVGPVSISKSFRTPRSRLASLPTPCTG